MTVDTKRLSALFSVLAAVLLPLPAAAQAVLSVTPTSVSVQGECGCRRTGPDRASQ